MYVCTQILKNCPFDGCMGEKGERGDVEPKVSYLVRLLKSINLIAVAGRDRTSRLLQLHCKLDITISRTLLIVDFKSIVIQK